MPATYDDDEDGPSPEARWAPADAPLAIALTIGAIHSLVVTLLPSLRLAYDKPALHLTLEAAEGLVAALLADLAAGRFRFTGRVDQLAMAWAYPCWPW